MKKQLLAASLLLCTHTAFADDIAVGESLYNNKGCVGCHGVKGNSMIPINPKLQGQHAEYLKASFNAYKSGARNNPIMSGMAALLSDEEMGQVAAYLAAQ